MQYRELELKKAGDSAILIVDETQIEEIGGYDYLVILGRNAHNEQAVKLKLTAKAADAQLARLGMGVEQMIGETMTFSRAANPTPGKHPYWNIARGARSVPRLIPAQTVAAIGRPAPDPALQPTLPMMAAAPDMTVDRQVVEDAVARTTDFFMGTIYPKLVEGGIAPENITFDANAMISTIIIQQAKLGCL